mgnify:CR=1 FL=1
MYVTRLAAVTPESGQQSVSPVTTRISSTLHRSTSAAIWTSAVDEPCPTSPIPTKRVNAPASSTSSLAPPGLERPPAPIP